MKAGGSTLKKVYSKSKCKTDNQNLVCFCGEMFAEPPTEPWIQCKTCTGWYHEAAVRLRSALLVKTDFTSCATGR